MSREYRNLIAAETKSGAGLLRSGRRGPNRSSILATAARGYLRFSAGVQEQTVRRRGRELGRIDDAVGKLQRMRRTHPKRVNRMFATAALVGGGGALDKQRRAERRWQRASRSLNRTQRALRHFGG